MRSNLLILCAIALHTAAGARPVDVPNSVSEVIRSDEAIRDVVVQLPPAELSTTVEIGRVADDSNGGGALGALIISARDNKREIMTQNAQERAAGLASPLRKTLAGLDIDTLAAATTKRAFAGVPWLHAGDLHTVPARNADGMLETTPAAKTPQVVLVVYGYEVSPDFTQLRVTADVLIKRSATAANMVPFYRARVVSIAELKKRSYDPGTNVAEWTAQDGTIARDALRKAFAGMELLLTRALTMSAADLARLDTAREGKVFAAGLLGQVVARPAELPGSTMIWANRTLVLVTPVG
jgi:hypothetical protein